MGHTELFDTKDFRCSDTGELNAEGVGLAELFDTKDSRPVEATYVESGLVFAL